MTEFWTRHWKKLVAIALVIKVLLLFWTAHPFDFWAFVNTIQRNTLYGWNLFEYWNKGGLLLAIWYPLYAAYLKILSLTGQQADNLLLLHFFFKVAFLFVDIAIGYLIARITSLSTQSKQLGLVAFLVWFLNPIPYYVYGLHGHYELLTPLAILLLLYGAVWRRPWPLALGFVIGFTTKYFLVILIPFVLIKLLAERQYRTLIIAVLASVAGLILSYLNLLLYPEQFRQLLGSIFELSGSNAPIGANVIPLAPLNIVAALYSLVYPSDLITNVTQPTLFWLANQGIKIVALLLIAHVVWRIVAVRRSGQYSTESLIVDFTLLLTYFLIFLTNFQAHYFSWLLPLIIVLLVAYRHAILRWHLVLLTVAGFIFAYKNEIGIRTFFLDLFNGFYPSGLGRVDPILLQRMGVVIIAVLSLMLVYLLARERFVRQSEEGLRLGSYWVSVGLLWVLMIVPAAQATYLYFSNTPETYLAYQRNNNIHRGVIFETFSVQSLENGVVTFSESNRNSLTLEEIRKLPEDKQRYFTLQVLFPDQESFEQARQSAALFRFNNCPLGPEKQEIYSLEKYRYYNGFTVSPVCLANKNALKLPSPDLNETLKANELGLYVQNVPVTHLYLESQAVRINLFAALGVLYLLVGGYLGRQWLKRLEEDA